MPSAYTRPPCHLTAIATVLVLAGVAFPASAGSRAPIVYVAEASTGPAPASRPASPAGSTDKATQRIEFRYPGSAAASTGRVEQASVSKPQASRSTAQQSYVEAPQFAAKSTFDAASTAAKVGTAGLAEVSTTAMQEPVMLAAPVAVEAAKAGAGKTEIAIVYGDEFAGLPTANGEIFDQSALTAAHPSLPLPSLVSVTNPANGKEVVVRVNDRGPFEDGATLQVSRQAARALGFDGAGKAELTLRVLGNAPEAALQVVPQPVAQPKKLLAAASLPVQPETASSWGDDELAGGASWTPAPAKARTAVKWPEPPADWNVAPAKQEVVPARITMAAAPTETVYVQLASFSDIGNAETLYRGLKADLPVEIVPARVNGTDYFRVRVGPMASRDAAQQLRDRLNAEGKGDGRVVSAE